MDSLFGGESMTPFEYESLPLGNINQGPVVDDQGREDVESDWSAHKQ